MTTLQLGKTDKGPFNVPLQIVTEKLAFLGMTGAGKTYSATKLAELMLAAGAQIIALDPVGVWRGLRMGWNFEIVIFGGQSGDVPLESTAGALVADLVVERGISAILDVSQFGTDVEHRRFALDFLTRFFHLKKSKPSAVHVFAEEAQEFCPQDKQHGDERMLHAFQRMWKLGRNYGIGGSIISQRPQDVNKKALNMSGTLFVHRMTAPGDRKVISSWVDEKGIDADVGAILPRLTVGCPHVWSPEFLKVSEEVKIAAKVTADVSSTPKVGAAAKAQAITPIDIEKLAKAMGDTIERAKENDPAELKRKIHELEKQIRTAAKPAPAPAPEIREVKVPDEKRCALIVDKLEKVEASLSALQDFRREIAREFNELRGVLLAPKRPHLPPFNPSQPPRFVSAAQTEEYNQALEAGHQKKVKETDRSNGTLGKAERAILQAMGWRHPRPCTKAQAAILSGYSIKSSSFSNALGALRSGNFINGAGDAMMFTQNGLAAAGNIAKAPDPDQRLDQWLSKLGKAERAILEFLFHHYAAPASKEQIAAATGYSITSSSFSNALGTLRSLELITREQNPRCTEILFE